jgi:hypothetical protein
MFIRRWIRRVIGVLVVFCVNFIEDNQSILAKKLSAYSSISVENRGIFVEFKPIR